MFGILLPFLSITDAPLILSSDAEVDETTPRVAPPDLEAGPVAVAGTGQRAENFTFFQSFRMMSSESSGLVTTGVDATVDRGHRSSSAHSFHSSQAPCRSFKHIPNVRR